MDTLSHMGMRVWRIWNDPRVLGFLGQRGIEIIMRLVMVSQCKL